MFTLDLINPHKYRVNQKKLEQTAVKTLRTVRHRGGEVEMIIVNNRQIQQINKSWRGVDAVTDVLAFAWREEHLFPGEKFLGQIFISYPRIKQQAAENNITVTEELHRMFVHGLLHLVGYDHVREREAREMFDLQEKVIMSIK